MNRVLALLGLTLLAVAGAPVAIATAAPFTLTFEELPAVADECPPGFLCIGLSPGDRVQDFYAGGFAFGDYTPRIINGVNFGSLPPHDIGPGPDYGITFSNDVFAVRDETTGRATISSDEACFGTIYPDGSIVDNCDEVFIMNVRDGFTGFLAFDYRLALGDTLSIFSGPDTTGDLLATIDLVGHGFCCNFASALLPFQGVARSVRFGFGSSPAPYYDDITLGNLLTVDGPAGWPLLGACVGALALAGRRRG